MLPESLCIEEQTVQTQFYIPCVNKATIHILEFPGTVAFCSSQLYTCTSTAVLKDQSKVYKVSGRRDISLEVLQLESQASCCHLTLRVRELGLLSSGRLCPLKRKVTLPLTRVRVTVTPDLPGDILTYDQLRYTVRVPSV